MFYISNKNNKLNQETGSATSVCLMISIGLVIGFQHYWPIPSEKITLPIQIAILIAAAFFVFVSFLFGLYKVLSGEKSIGQMKRIIRKEKKKLLLVVQEIKEEIQKFEKEIKHSSGIMMPEGFEELITTKALISSLDSRIATVNELLKEKDSYYVSIAYNAMFEDVSVKGDPISGLILSDDDTSFSYDKIKKEFDSRLKHLIKLMPSSQRPRARVATN